MSGITEILKLKGDKEALVPNGDRIAVEGGGTYKDYEYLIVLNTTGHRCGYVALPPEHKYSQTPMEERTIFGKTYKHWDYDSLDIDVHGGLTFMSPEHDLKDLLPVPCADMWIGFDCGHTYNDMCDIEAYKKYFGKESTETKKSFFDAMIHGYDVQTVKTFKYAEKECHGIIDQLIEKVA